MKKALGRYWLAFDLLIGGIAFMGLFASELDVAMKVFLAFAVVLIAGLIDLHAMEAASARDTYHNENIVALQALEARMEGRNTATILDSVQQNRRARNFEDIATHGGLLEVALHLAKCAAWPLIGWGGTSWIWPLLNH